MRVALIALLLLTGCVHRPPTGDAPPAKEFVSATDGWPLALYHYPATVTHARPVLLCHGLGSNHVSLDLEPGGSLARYLAAQGFDVWAMDLRAHGGSRARPKGGEKVSAVCFDDYVRKDLPAVIEHVRARTGKDLAWVGHSMGGMVAYAYLGTGGEGIADFVAIASPGTVTHSGLVHGISNLSVPAEVLPKVHARFFGRLNAECGGWVPFHFDNLIYNRDDLSLRERRLLGAYALEDLTRGEVRQFRRWEKRHVWDSNGGTVDYSASLASVRVPALLLSGSADRLVPRGTVQFVMARLGSPDKTHRSFGKDMGDAHDFGHVDLACGALAEKEVYPEIAAWLAAHDLGVRR